MQRKFLLLQKSFEQKFRLKIYPSDRQYLYEQAEIVCPNPPAITLRFNSSTSANKQKIEKSQYRKCNIGASKNATEHFLRRDDFYIFYIGFFLFSSIVSELNCYPIALFPV